MPPKVQGNGDYTFLTTNERFTQPDYDNSTKAEDAADEDDEENEQHCDDMYDNVIDILADAQGAVGGLDDEDADEVDNNCYFLVDATKDVNFEHIPVPAELEEALKSGVHICVLFMTV